MFDDGDEDFGGSILEQLQAVSDEDREAEDFIEEDVQEALAGHVQQLKEQHQQAVDLGRTRGHAPVLLWSALQFLFLPSRLLDRKYTGTYVDCTFGRGGFSREMLARIHDRGRLFAFDIDPTAVEEGKKLEKEDPRFHMVHAPFATVCEKLEGKTVDGIMMDIGVSNPQVMDDERGFSLQRLAEVAKPVDMRMNPDVGMSASEWLQTVSVEQLAWVLHTFGPENGLSLHAERVAQAIIDEQKLNGPYLSMNRLAKVVGITSGFPDEAESFEHPTSGVDHPARLYVQAIRIFLNQELLQLESGLSAAFQLLVMGGRLLVNVFKQSECRALTDFISRHEEPDPETRKRVSPARRLRELYPLLGTDLDYSVKVIGKPTKPSAYEVTQNRRARSGQMFVLEKVPRQVKRRVRARPRLERNRFKEAPLVPIFIEPAEA